MAKRAKLEIMRDTLNIIQEHHNHIKWTVLLRKSKISSSRFKEFYGELVSKGLVATVIVQKDKQIILTDKGFRFLERYKAIVDFIKEFEL